MAAFLYPLGEIILEGLGAGLATNMTNEVVNTFKPIVARKIGSEVADYAKNHPKGFLAQSLDSATKTRYQAIQEGNKAKDKTKMKLLEEAKAKRKMYENQHYRYEHSYRKGSRRSRH
jgi:hypothetical protein